MRGGGGDWKNCALVLYDRMGRPARSSWFLIDPRKSSRIGYWDALTSLALIYTALVTPAEVALLEPATHFLEPLFVINRVVDATFALDMIIQFFIMVEVPNRDAASRGTVWLSKRSAIARHYLLGWFPIDALSILVSGFDFMGFDFVIDMLGDDAGSLAKLKILRVLRILRLVKLVRLLRASRMLKRWEQRFPINYALLSLTKATGSVVLLAHWFACTWVLQAKVQDDLSSTWLGKYALCTPSPAVGGTVGRALALSVGASDSPPPTATPVVYVCPALETYMNSLYFATMTITSIGYGDITPTMSNWIEQLLCVLLMLLAGVVWCQMIGVFSGVISSFNPEQNAFRSTMDELNRFIAREQLADELAGRLRGYFHQSKHLRAAKQQQLLMGAMPPTLQGEVSWATNSTWLNNIWFLQGCEAHFMLELSLQMHAVVFSPSDIAPHGYLFIICRGVALYRGKVLTKGKVFGEDMILFDEKLRSRAAARAMNYVEANYISRTELLMLSNRYPATRKKIRRAAIMLSLRREIVQLAATTQERMRANGEVSVSPGSKSLKSMAGLTSLFEAIEGARAAGADADTAAPGAEGGHLEGHTNDLGVQFEIVGETLAELRRGMAKQAADSEATHREMAELREETRRLVHALAGTRPPVSAMPNAVPNLPPLVQLMDGPDGWPSLVARPQPAMTMTPPDSFEGAGGGGAAVALAMAGPRGASRRSAEDRMQDGQWGYAKGAPCTSVGPEMAGRHRHRHRHRPRRDAKQEPPPAADDDLLDA